MLYLAKGHHFAVKLLCFIPVFLAHDRMSVASLYNYDLSVVVCEHSSWPHAWPNKVHTLHAHASISCIVAHQKLYHSDLYLLYSSHICMFILMSIVHEVINIATSALSHTSKRWDHSDLYSLILSYISFWLIAINLHFSDILNFIYQWLGNYWSWRGDYLGRLKATLQYSKFHLSLTGQLLVVKGWLLGEAGGHLTNYTITNILNFSMDVSHSVWFNVSLRIFSKTEL